MGGNDAYAVDYPAYYENAETCIGCPNHEYWAKVAHMSCRLGKAQVKLFKPNNAYILAPYYKDCRNYQDTKEAFLADYRAQLAVELAEYHVYAEHMKNREYPAKTSEASENPAAEHFA